MKRLHRYFLLEYSSIEDYSQCKRNRITVVYSYKQWQVL